MSRASERAQAVAAMEPAPSRRRRSQPVVAECHGCLQSNDEPQAAAWAVRHNREVGHRVVIMRVVRVLDGSVL